MFRRVTCPECLGQRNRRIPGGRRHRCRCCKGKGIIR